MTRGGGVDRAVRKGLELQQLTATQTGADVGQEGAAPSESAAWRRLEDQIGWYDAKSGQNQQQNEIPRQARDQ
jgi:hypothetical protein